MRGKKKTDDNYMGGNILIPVTQKYYCDCKEYSTSDNLQGNVYDQSKINTRTHKSKYHWTDVSCNNKVMVKEDYIEIVYNMVAYK